jgi:hypothetical protein
VSSEQHRAVTIVLSPAQVDEVVRAASDGRVPGIAALIGNSLAPAPQDDAASDVPAGEQPRAPQRFGYLLSDTADPRFSRSLVRGLSILTCFAPDGQARGIVELAEDLAMSPSTAYRYASTLVELGLLERCPRTRKYRPAAALGARQAP